MWLRGINIHERSQRLDDNAFRRYIFDREIDKPRGILLLKPFFLDFENNKAGEFYLAGFESDGVFEQRVLNANLEGLARFKNLKNEEPNVFLNKVLRRMTDEQFVLVAYSTAELSVINSMLAAKAERRQFTHLRYLNLLSAAKRWIRKHKKNDFEALAPFRIGADDYTQKRQRYSLASVMRLTNFQAEKDYAPGKTTSRFNAVISALKLKEQNFDALTAVQKAKATKALKHNEFDVKAMKVLFNLIKEQDASCFQKSIVKLFGESE